MSIQHEHPTTLPALPPIDSCQIREQVFTHRSYYARPTHVFEDHPEDPSPDNEKFEHLGDTVLGLIVTAFLTELYPGLRVGPSSKIRAMVVGNPTLADISTRYRLTDQLRVHPAQEITLKASINVQADVFESYVGGLYADRGLETVQAWLRALFEPYILSAYRIVRAQHGLPSPPESMDRRVETAANELEKLTLNIAGGPRARRAPHHLASPTTIGHLALFNQTIQKANREIEWVYALDGAYPPPSTAPTHPDPELTAQGRLVLVPKTMRMPSPVWGVRVLVDGESFGEGRGNTKKAARNEAAKLGLEKLGFRFCPESVDAPRGHSGARGLGTQMRGFSRLGFDGRMEFGVVKAGVHDTDSGGQSLGGTRRFSASPVLERSGIRMWRLARTFVK